ncbi:MAG: hypothetical protein AB2608_16010 [Candidatus Thiodiazotropha sp.]
MLETTMNFITAISNLFTILASGIAIWVFFTKRKAISSAFSLLVNYSFQLTLSELKEKLERLNDFHAADDAGREQIVILLHETVGQIKGNSRLRKPMNDLVETANKLASDKRRLTEPRKRAFVAELRERIRHLNIENVEAISGDNP